MVTNMGAGMTNRPLSHDEVVEVMARNTKNVRQLALDALVRVSKERACSCEGTAAQRMGNG